MKTLLAMTVGVLPLLFPVAAYAQNESMMNAGNWGGRWMDGVGGYAGVWMPVLPFIAVVVLLFLVITQRRK